MANKFDCDELSERIHQEYATYQMNLIQTDSKKAIALLQTNYFQNCLKDLMENILQSKEVRRIPIKLIISILKNREILSSEKAIDVIKICDIRD
jgi:hypothetical protein